MKPLENVEVKLRSLLVNTLQTLHQAPCLPLLPPSPAPVMWILMRHHAKPQNSCSAVRPLGTEWGHKMHPWSPLRQLGKCRAPKPLTHPTAPTNLSMDQQGCFVLPAKASKVQLKRAMVPWWQTNNIKANPIISITMAKRGNTRGTPPSQTSVDSRRCAMDCLLCAMISCSGQWVGTPGRHSGALRCSDVDLATAFFPSSPRNGSWRLTTAKTKSKQKRGKKKGCSW